MENNKLYVAKTRNICVMLILVIRTLTSFHAILLHALFFFFLRIIRNYIAVNHVTVIPLIFRCVRNPPPLHLNRSSFSQLTYYEDSYEPNNAKFHIVVIEKNIGKMSSEESVNASASSNEIHVCIKDGCSQRTLRTK